MRKFNQWVLKLLKKSIENIVVTLSTAIAIGFLGLLILLREPLLSGDLYKILLEKIYIPAYLVIFLGVFSVIGVLIPAFNIIKLFSEMRSRSTNVHIEKITFEEFPREWRVKVWKENNEWQISDDIEVYCSTHNLKLNIPTLNIQGAGTVVCTQCDDCKKENLPSAFNHTHPNQNFTDDFPAFKTTVKNRILRQLIQKSTKP